jgi:hypothetical protein
MPLKVVILCIIIVGVRHQKSFTLLFFKFILWIYIHSFFLKIMFIVQKNLEKDNDQFSWLCLGLGSGGTTNTSLQHFFSKNE